MWHRRCENPQALTGLYDADEGLERVRLVEVALQADGRRMQLRMDLPRFADHPPPRWDPEASMVQVTVSFWEVSEVRVEGWTGEQAGTLALSPDGDGLRLAFDAPGVRLRARCLLARIDRVSAYAVWPDEPDPRTATPPGP